MKLMKFLAFFVATSSLVDADSGSIRSADKNSSGGAGSEVSDKSHEMCNNYDAFLLLLSHSLLCYFIILLKRRNCVLSRSFH